MLRMKARGKELEKYGILFRNVLYCVKSKIMTRLNDLRRKNTCKSVWVYMRVKLRVYRVNDYKVRMYLNIFQNIL